MPGRGFSAPHPREIFVGVAVALTLAVDERRGVRQGVGPALVVVGDDHVHADLAGVGGLLHGGDAAVHRDDERHTPCLERVERGTVETVALLVPVGDVVIAAQPLAAQPVRQHTGGGDAVHVVVAVDRHGLPALNRPEDARAGLSHPQHEHRIMQGLLPAEEQGLCLCGRGEPPPLPARPW